MTHGWPGSVIELLKVIEPLTDPTAHGGSAATRSTWSFRRCPATGSRASRRRPAGIPTASRAPGRADEAPGIHHYVAQGGDWGAVVTDADGRRGAAGPDRHPRQHAGDGAARRRAGVRSAAGDPRPPACRRRSARLGAAQLLYRSGLGYARGDGPGRRRSTRWRTPRSAWRPGCSTTTLRSYGHDRASLRRAIRRGLTRDDVLDNVTLYWLTNTAVSSARLYSENGARRSSTPRTSPSRPR